MTEIQAIKIGENATIIRGSTVGKIDLTATDENYVQFPIEAFSASGKLLTTVYVGFTRSAMTTYMATNPTPAQILQTIEDAAVTKYGLTKV